MILVASPSKPFAYTVKGTPRRQAVIDNYETEIVELYAAVAETAQSQIEPPASWSKIESLNFVRTIITKVMQQTLEDSDDLFQHGCDR